MTNDAARLRLSLFVALGLFANGCLVGSDAPAGTAEEESAIATPAGKTVTFQNGVAPSSQYAGESDTTLEEATPTSNHGADAFVRADVDYPTGSRKRSDGLLRFDLGAIPVGSTITSVKLILNVTNRTTGTGYSLYPLSRAWSEAEATWVSAKSGVAWATDGARGAVDRGNAPIAALTPTVTGKTTVTFDTAGIALAQAWVNHAATNFGMVLDTSDDADGLLFDSSNATTESNRPELAVTYTPPPPATTCRVLPTGAGYYAMASSPHPTDLHAALQWAESRRAADKLEKATLTVERGTYAIGGFVNARDIHGTPLAAVVAPEHIGIQGAGSACTVFKLSTTAPWSTRVTTTGATPNYATNKYSVLRITDGGSGNVYEDFTLDASRPSGTWPHEFNGIELRSAAAGQMNHVRVIGVPGSENIPPHETFAINYFHCTDFVSSNVEVDGHHVGASGFGVNNSTGLVFNSVWAHDMHASHGIANYDSRDITVNDGIFENNGTGTGAEGGVGINNEGGLGTFHFNRCISRGNALAATRVYADANSFANHGAETQYLYRDCVITAGESGVALRYAGLQANGGGELVQKLGTTAAHWTGTTTNKR